MSVSSTSVSAHLECSVTETAELVFSVSRSTRAQP